MTVLHKKLLESLPHLNIIQTFFGYWFAYESVIIARRIPAFLFITVQRPEILSAVLTFLPFETLPTEELYLILIFPFIVPFPKPQGISSPRPNPSRAAIGPCRQAEGCVTKEIHFVGRRRKE